MDDTTFLSSSNVWLYNALVSVTYIIVHFCPGKQFVSENIWKDNFYISDVYLFISSNQQQSHSRDDRLFYFQNENYKLNVSMLPSFALTLIQKTRNQTNRSLIKFYIFCILGI